MTRGMRAGTLLLAGALLPAAGAAFGQDKAAGQADKPNPMVEAWLKAAATGPEHQRLAPLAGSWTSTIKVWMEPGKPPVEWTATAERKWILGGRFLQEEITGRFMGQPFQGLGLIGYDNLQKKYTWTWADSMSTTISTASGTADASGKVLTFIREEIDPASGKKVKGKDVIRIKGPDQHVLEMFKDGPDGKEIKVMEITATRKAK